MKPNIIITLIGAFLVVSGTFLPWVSFFGMKTANVWDQGSTAPLFFIFCVAVCVAMAFIAKKWVNVFSVVFSLILTALGLLYLSDVGMLAGNGLYLFFFGGIVLLVGAILGFFQKIDSKKNVTIATDEIN